MDATTERIVDYALQARFDALSPQTVHHCKQRLLDTFGCVIGAYDAALCRKAREFAERYPTERGVTIWGSAVKTTPEAAVFANGVTARFLDLSDTFLAKSRGHPSDVMSAILAAAELVRADGRSTINAIVLAYDIYCSFAASIDIHTKGWDQPVYGVMASALGAGKLLGLTREQMGHAVSLALAPNMALAQARQGSDLSNWKGCAGANAARNAIFAALLARDGFDGPTAVFEGTGGLWNVLGRFEWPLPSAPRHMISETHLKELPVCYHGQSAVWAAIGLRDQVRVEDISEIEIDTYRSAIIMMANDPMRWAPTNHETADHSLPYVVSVALVDGEITGRSFAHERLTDPLLASLMRKVKVTEDKALTAKYPEASPNRVRVLLSSGKTVTNEVDYPRGHVKNPMDDAAIDAKFRTMFRGRGTDEQCEKALRALRNFDQAADVKNDVLKLLEITH